MEHFIVLFRPAFCYCALSHPDLLLSTLLLNTVNIYSCFRAGVHESRPARSPGLPNCIQWCLSICRSSVWNLLHVVHLGPRVSRLLPYF